MPRNARRAALPGPTVAKENLMSPGETATTASGKKPRHRLSTAELTRLEDVFRQETHPSRQRKRELAAQLGMDYKTVTIWFQNKRQTSKRGQPPVEKPGAEGRPQRARADSSCLRAVSSPLHNATLDACEVVPTASSVDDSLTGSSGASKAVVKIRPLLDSLNALTPRQRGQSEPPTGANDTVLSVAGADDAHQPLVVVENVTVLAEQEQPEYVRALKWKRIRTLEWACERQAKRRKSSKEGFVALGSPEAQDDDPDDRHVDSALSLLSLASQVGPPMDVLRGALLLLGFKHSWRRK